MVRVRVRVRVRVSSISYLSTDVVGGGKDLEPPVHHLRNGCFLIRHLLEKDGHFTSDRVDRLSPSHPLP